MTRRDPRRLPLSRADHLFDWYATYNANIVYASRHLTLPASQRFLPTARRRAALKVSQP